MYYTNFYYENGDVVVLRQHVGISHRTYRRTDAVKQICTDMRVG